MPVTDLIIRGRRVVFADHVGPASIHICEGRVTFVGGIEESTGDCEVLDVGDDALVMPGLVDTHVHINSPGRTEWEGFATATKAAAAGGVTTLIDMPLNSVPPTTTTEGLQAKLNAASNNCYVDIGFWAGVIPGNTQQLAALHEAGAVGFKCFLVPSGVDEFAHVTEKDLLDAMPELSRLGALLIVHAELPGPIERATRTIGPANDYSTFLSSRPREAENAAIEMLIRLSRDYGTRVHIVHLSSADGIPLLREAQAAGVRISAETCPHYLHFAAETIPNGATEFKCCPPIRELDNREELWRGLTSGTIDFVVSDHSPCPASLKLREQGDFRNAWGGIASLQLRLPVMWTEVQSRGLSLLDLTRWLCSGPAAQVGLDHRKGSIAPGFDADFVIWNPDEQFTVESSNLFHRHKVSPYIGETLRGVVQKTFLRGRKIYDGGEIDGASTGEFLLGTHFKN